MNRIFNKITFVLKPLIEILLLLIVLLQLQACETSPKKLLIRYEASSDLNPDINLRPSPLVVNSYQLSNQTSFQDLDFFTLYDKAKTTLGDGLLYQDQIEIKPKQVIETEQEYFKKTKFLAIMAAYRDIDNAVWQKVILLDPKEKKPIRVLLSSKEVIIQQGNP